MLILIVSLTAGALSSAHRLVDSEVEIGHSVYLIRLATATQSLFVTACVLAFKAVTPLLHVGHIYD